MYARRTIALSYAQRRQRACDRAVSSDCFGSLPFPAPTTNKTQLLELCARVGFTPPARFQPESFFRLEASLEANSCHRNMRS